MNGYVSPELAAYIATLALAVLSIVLGKFLLQFRKKLKLVIALLESIDKMIEDNKVEVQELADVMGKVNKVIADP